MYIPLLLAKRSRRSLTRIKQKNTHLTNYYFKTNICQATLRLFIQKKVFIVKSMERKCKNAFGYLPRALSLRSHMRIPFLKRYPDDRCRIKKIPFIFIYGKNEKKKTFVKLLCYVTTQKIECNSKKALANVIIILSYFTYDTYLGSLTRQYLYMSRSGSHLGLLDDLTAATIVQLLIFRWSLHLFVFSLLTIKYLPTYYDIALLCLHKNT